MASKPVSKTGVRVLGLVLMMLLAGCADAASPDSSTDEGVPPSQTSMASVEASWGTDPDQPTVDRSSLEWCSNQTNNCEIGVEILDVGDANARLIQTAPFTTGEFSVRSVAQVWIWTSIDGLDEEPTYEVDEERLTTSLTEISDDLTYSRIVSDAGWSSEGEQPPESSFFSPQIAPWNIDGLPIGGVNARVRESRDSVVALTLPPPTELGVGARWIVTEELAAAETVVATIEVEVLAIEDQQATLSFSGTIEWAEPFQPRGDSFFGGWHVSGTVTWFEDSPVPSAVFEVVGETEFEAIEHLNDPDAPLVIISERRLMVIEPVPQR